MSATVTQTLTIMSSPPLPPSAAPRPSAFSPPMSPSSSILSASSSPSTPGARSISTLTSSPIHHPLKSLKRHRPEPLNQPLPSAAATIATQQSIVALPLASYPASAASIFALSDLHSPTRPSTKRSKVLSSVSSLASPTSAESSRSHASDQSPPVSPFSSSSSVVSPSSTSSVTGFASFLPHPPTTATSASTTTSAATSPTSPTATSLPPLLTLSIPNRTSWFSLHSVDAIEKRALPEFFTKRNPPPTVTQANTRTPLPLVHQRPVSPTQPPVLSLVPPPSLSAGSGAQSYMRYRNVLLLASAMRPDAYLTGTECRRMLGGVNAASVLRIHAFLESWGLINQHVMQHQQGSGRKEVVVVGGGEESGVGVGLGVSVSSVTGGGTGGAGDRKRKAGGKRSVVTMEGMEMFAADKTFESLADDDGSVMHDMSLPIAMGIAV